MKTAVTDACIFIDLYHLQLTTEFFSLEIKVHTSYDVVNQLCEQQKQVLKAFQSVGKLTVHNISENQRKEIISLNYPISLANSDKTVIYLASQLRAPIISSYKTVRNTAKQNAIAYHSMFWILDELVTNMILSGQEAAIKLKKLISSNIIYQNNKELIAEMNKRLSQWTQ